jgi:drug/metabolite transporter (DMT)-like permease
MKVISPLDQDPGLKKPQVSGNLFAIGSMVLWAAGFPAAEALLETWHPISLIFARLVLTLLVLYPVWIWTENKKRFSKEIWVTGLSIGFVGFGVGTVLLLFGQWYTNPVTVALVSTTTPIMATVIEVIKRQRTMTLTFTLGLLASVIGGCIAVSAQISVDLGFGLFLSILACFLFAWASDASISKLPELSTLARTTITFSGAFLFSGILLVIFWFVTGVSFPKIISAHDTGNLLVYSILAMAISQLFFLSSVARIGIALTSIHMNIAPFYVMFFVVLSGGSWEINVVIGATLVALGVAIAQRKSVR